MHQSPKFAIFALVSRLTHWLWSKTCLSMANPQLRSHERPVDSEVSLLGEVACTNPALGTLHYDRPGLEWCLSMVGAARATRAPTSPFLHGILSKSFDPNTALLAFRLPSTSESFGGSGHHDFTDGGHEL